MSTLRVAVKKTNEVNTSRARKRELAREMRCQKERESVCVMKGKERHYYLPVRLLMRSHNLFLAARRPHCTAKRELFRQLWAY